MDDVTKRVLSLSSDQGSPARGLPAAAYTDGVFWQIECESVLTQNWVFAGFSHELAESGDAVPVTVAGKPVLLLKNQKSEIAVFHNVCRHRCLKLIDQPKNVGKRITCPYHAWTYDLDGTLRATPNFGGIRQHRLDGFDPADHGLHPVRVAVWHDWIFVNLSGDAPPFEDYAAPLIKRLDGIDFGKVQPVATLDFGEIATNWKLLMENFIEPYHVPIVHRTTTDQPLSDHFTIVDGLCLGAGVDVRGDNVSASGKLAVSSRYLTLFPNFVIGRYFPDQLGVHLNVPLGPGRTAQKRVIYTTEGQDLSGAEVEGLKKLWWDVHKEDHSMCERLQLGRASPVAESGGVLSPHWEDGILAFQKLVVAAATKSNKVEAGIADV